MANKKQHRPKGKRKWNQDPPDSYPRRVARYADSKTLQTYVAHCPSCGVPLRFAKAFRAGNTEGVQGTCTDLGCGRRWSLVFDLDPSGTFGVMSFQCDNEDRLCYREAITARLPVVQ